MTRVRSVFVVDDEPDIATSLVAILKRQGLPRDGFYLTAEGAGSSTISGSRHHDFRCADAGAKRH